ncbi:MAG: 4-(cytidine 5'-diphospho)-2-C-methyl-D-erythritol kinase [Dethiobacter sp.]|jgi:4-diphosphocytidyl-2-C-methyl-D-erythritol kinase|nr:4-(cytidine 5'-diphospho)-2-C-methyl-D-erythritol kinase [Dethiobacter sp.]
MKTSLIVQAPAKINLGLAVLGRRADGYHDLASVMQQISLSDTLVFTPRFEEGWEFFCTDAALSGPNNLVCQAAELLSGESGRRLPGVKITLYKQIPVAAGLGGGSSDAAATLKALNCFWNLGLTDCRLKEIGASLGSDIPYCLQGGTVLVTGRGEALAPLTSLPFYWVVLAMPKGLQLSTAAVYGSLNPARASKPPISYLVEAIKEGNSAKIEEWFKRGLVNTLEEAVLPDCAPISRLKDRFLELDLNPAMSGSGPAVFALTDSYQAALSALRILKEEELRAFICWTIPFNSRKED